MYKTAFKPNNHENLVHMLSELQFPFSVIGLSEIKFKVDKDIITMLTFQVMILFHSQASQMQEVLASI